MKIRLPMIIGLIIYAGSSFGMHNKEDFGGLCLRSQDSERLGLNRGHIKQEFICIVDQERIDKMVHEQELEIQKNIAQRKIQEEQEKNKMAANKGCCLNRYYDFSDIKEGSITEDNIMEELGKVKRLPVLVNHYEEYKAARKALKFLHRLHFCPKIKLLEWKK